jgi:hypothetical protein
MSEPRAADIRFRVDPADVPAEKAARRLHLTVQKFNELLPNLLKRGFPAADPDTGLFDLEAIDRWRRNRHGLVSLDPVAQNSRPERKSWVDRLGGRREA